MVFLPKKVRWSDELFHHTRANLDINMLTGCDSWWLALDFSSLGEGYESRGLGHLKASGIINGIILCTLTELGFLRSGIQCDNFKTGISVSNLHPQMLA